jgi:hypothetical protein
MSRLPALALAALTLAGGGRALKVSELAAKQAGKGTYEVEGYVIKAYHCPPCPPGAMCKPCMRDNVVLSDEPRHIDLYTEQGAAEVIVFTQGVEGAALEVGKRYRLKVEVQAQSTTDRGHDVQLIAVVR